MSPCRNGATPPGMPFDAMIEHGVVDAVEVHCCALLRMERSIPVLRWIPAFRGNDKLPQSTQSSPDFAGLLARKRDRVEHQKALVTPPQ